jgi:hypothetical protein
MLYLKTGTSLYIILDHLISQKQNISLNPYFILINNSGHSSFCFEWQMKQTLNEWKTRNLE